MSRSATGNSDWPRALLAWYRRHRRALPWREQASPYAVWVSEIMLQQTRVEAVLPYFQRFMARFPDVAALAAAPPGDVLRVWEGLGYYSRARNLHRAAGIVVRQHGGRFPSEVAAWRELPGVGAYTAAAIGSICFGARVPVVDGNVQRLFARFWMMDGDPRKPAVRRELAERLRGAMGRFKPGDFNQAVMELGAMVCRPRNPACTPCPLANRCRALAAGRVDDYPRRRARPQTPLRVHLAGAVWKRGRLLLVQRPPHGLLGGLWRLPGGRWDERASPSAALTRFIEQETGIRVTAHAHTETIRHAYSHFRMELRVYRCQVRSGRLRAAARRRARWVPCNELHALPLDKANRRAADAALDSHA